MHIYIVFLLQTCFYPQKGKTLAILILIGYQQRVMCLTSVYRAFLCIRRGVPGDSIRLVEVYTRPLYRKNKLTDCSIGEPTTTKI